MLQIRRDQLLALEEATGRDFEDYLVAHLKGFSPAHVTVLG
jgi:hypothetical protein